MKLNAGWRLLIAWWVFVLGVIVASRLDDFDHALEPFKPYFYFFIYIIENH